MRRIANSFTSVARNFPAAPGGSHCVRPGQSPRGPAPPFRSSRSLRQRSIMSLPLTRRIARAALLIAAGAASVVGAAGCGERRRTADDRCRGRADRPGHRGPRQVRRRRVADRRALARKSSTSRPEASGPDRRARLSPKRAAAATPRRHEGRGRHRRGSPRHPASSRPPRANAEVPQAAAARRARTATVSRACPRPPDLLGRRPVRSAADRHIRKGPRRVLRGPFPCLFLTAGHELPVTDG